MTRRGAVSPKSGPAPAKKKAAAAPSRRTSAKPALVPASPEPDQEPLRLETRPSSRRNVESPRKPAPARTLRRPGRTAIGALLLACVGAAMVVGVVRALSARSHRIGSVAAATPVQLPAGAPVAPIQPAAEAKPILADYRPPDRDEVRRAYVNVAAVYRTEGLSGVVRQSMDCFSGLAQAPSYPVLDYCIAADAYGEALQRKLSDDQAPAPGGYFASAQARELKAAGAVVGADGDPGARVLDVHRLAGEVSQVGPAAAALVVADNDRAVSQQQTGAVQGAVTEAPPPKFVLGAPQTVPVHTVAAQTASPAPVSRARGAAVEDRPAARVEKASASSAPPRPKLTKIAAPVEPRPARRPKTIKVSVPVPAHAARGPERLIAERAPARFERAHVVRTAVPAALRASQLHRTAAGPRIAPGWARPIRASTGARDEAPTTWTIAARDHPRTPAPARDRLDPVIRRATEPSEWVDCRQPRSDAEFRMCAGPTSGDGTLQGQYRSGRYRNR